jgi:hypothetical protein
VIKLFFYFSLIIIVLLPNKFEIWSQILDYNLDINSEFTAHTIRWFFINGLTEFVSNVFNLSNELAFNFLCKLALIAETYIIYKLIRIKNISKYYSFFLIILPTLISIFQNGRGVIGCLGITLIYFTANFKFTKTITILFTLISFLCVNVSSGIYSTFFILFCSFFLVKTKNPILNSKLFLIIFILINSPLFYLYFLKNFTFYDSSILKMLDHGFMFFFKDYKEIKSVVLIIISIIVLTASLLIMINFKKIINNQNFVFLFVSLIGLAFGFSAFFGFIFVNAFIIPSLFSLKRKYIAI